MAIATDIDPRILNSIIEKTLLSVPQSDRSIQKISDTVTSIHNAFNQIYTYSNNINKLSDVQYKTMLAMSKETSMETKLQNNILKVSNNVDNTELVKNFTGLSKSVQQLTERLSILDLSKQSQLDIDLDRKRRRGGRVGKFGKLARFGGLAGAGIVTGLVAYEMLSEEEPEVLPEVTPTPVPAPQIEMPVPEVKPAPIQQPPTVTPPVTKTPVPVAQPPTVKPPEIKTTPVPVVKPPPVPEVPKPITKAPDAAAVSKSVVPSEKAKKERGIYKDITPEGRALLEVIAGTESPGYNIIYGGSSLSQYGKDYSDHPRVFITIKSGPNKGQKSSAAGKYQFLSRTWDDMAKRYDLKDFSPENQDKAAWYKAQERYYNETKRNLQADLQSNDATLINSIGVALNREWTSLVGGIEQSKQYNKQTFESKFTSKLTQIKSETPKQFSTNQNVPSVQQPPSTSIISGTGKNTQTAAASSTAETFLAVQKRA